MKEVPEFLKNIINNSKDIACKHCDYNLSDNSLLSIGVRKSLSNKPIEVFFVEMKCPSCKKETLFELEKMTIIDLALHVIYDADEETEDVEFLSDKKHEKPNKLSDISNRDRHPIRSHITKKNISDINNFLDNALDINDLLLHMGENPENLKNEHNQ